MRKSLYPRLAGQSLVNNRRFFVPYILALMGNAAAFYIMSALVNDPGVKDMVPGRANAYMYVESFMAIGMVVALIFSLIFVLYINSFLMKQRKKELGLYNILGMGKGHIAVVLFFETVYVGLAGIGGGLLAGILLHKLVTLLLYRMLSFSVPFGFSISWTAMGRTAGAFAALLALTLLENLAKVRASKPIELLRGGDVGEREPKTRWLLTLLGILTLGGGYYIAVKTSNGAEAIAMYFVAVILVIIGTYCLFTAVSIFILKALRANKKFYYQTRHFIGVSGMLYRMKQNAVGLANICILCTMVMVMVSGTLSLYLGTGDMIDQRYPGDINIHLRYGADPEAGEVPFDSAAMLALQTGFVESRGLTVTGARTCRELGFGAGLLSDGSYTTDRFAEGVQGSVVSITCVTEDYYRAATGESLNLAADEVAVYGMAGDELAVRWMVPDVGTELGVSTYRVVRHLEKNPRFSPMITQMVTVVVRDDAVLEDLYRNQKAAYGASTSDLMWYLYLDVDATEEELADLEQAYWSASSQAAFYDGTGSWQSCSWELRAAGERDGYAMAGGFLFLGIFLGFIFLMATVLIIYYKQISEGYEDKNRFEIMQKVGLSRGEVRSSIRSQILMVFFLPILVASIHILFDFNMVEKLLTLFYIQNSTITALCTLGTVLVFFAAYGAVYMLTARVYYKIVER